MITLEIGSQVRTLPEDWHELSDNNMCYIFEHYYSSLQDFDRSVFLSDIVIKLLDYRPSSRWRAKNSNKIEDVNCNLAQMAELVSWILNDNNSLSWKGIITPFENGVKPLYEDLSFGAFRECVEILSNLEQLHEINLTVLPLLTTAKLSPWQQNITILQFINTLNHIQGNEIDIIGKKINLSALFSGGDNSSSDNLGWFSVRCWLVETGSFGSPQSVDELPFWEMILYLYNNHINYKNAKRKS